MASRYERDDVSRSYAWLGHEGFTEVVALDARYRPGRAFRDWNREGGCFLVWGMFVVRLLCCVLLIVLLVIVWCVVR